jgi:hypothetical protein
MLFSASTGLYALCNTDVFTIYILFYCHCSDTFRFQRQTVSEREKRDERLRERGSWSGGGILAVRKNE